jgi:hypothetical protein
LLPQISGITEYAPPLMPPKKWLGEANRINSPIKEDKAKLELSGIKQHYPDSFEAHVGAHDLECSTDYYLHK